METWVQRQLYIHKLNLPLDCIRYIKSWLQLDVDHCYIMKQRVIDEVIDMYQYSNAINDESDRFLFGDAWTLSFQSIFCLQCGNYDIIQVGQLSRHTKCNCN